MAIMTDQTPSTPSPFVAWRRANRPRLRRSAPVGVVHSGQRRRVYSCICGDIVTMCATWPMPVSVAAWIARHNATCDPCAPEVTA